ncbi:MAG: hypothetical protein ACK5X3_11020 [Pseudomonadota bacterium]
MKLSHTCHQSDAKRWHVEWAGRANSGQTNAQKQEMMMADPKAQLQRLINSIGNGGGAYLSRIACMNGRMAERKDKNAPGFFDDAPDVTVGQACRALMEFSADATARGDNTPAELLAPFRELVDFSSTNPNPQRNQAAQRLVNGYVNGSRNPANANSTGLPIQLDGQGKTYQLTPGAALDAEFTSTVLGVRAGRRQIPNRLFPQATEAQINDAVDACARGRATLNQCGSVGQEVAAIYLRRQGNQAAR